MTYIELKNVRKTYKVGGVEIHAVSGISLVIEKGTFNVIVGPSGAGKTTVMNILGGMDTPSSGSVSVDGKVITRLSDKEMTQYRRDDVGFVFQSYNLIPNLTVVENVELATQICKDAKDVIETLDQVGLGERLHNFPSQISGGEQQRVAIARALAKNPKLLLCDEPTGALDTDTGTQVLRVLQTCSKDFGMTVVVITHNTVITELADHVFEIKNGRVEKDYQNQNIKTVDDITW